jgi:hypothetical protein
MRKTYFLMIAFLFLALSIRGYAEPNWSSPLNTTHGNYESLTYSTFNVTWLNGTDITFVNTTEVKIEINYTGTPTNYSMNLVSGNEYNGIYGYQEILGAGTYQWRSCAIDNETKDNCTEFYYFTINPTVTSINLTLDGTEGNKTYNLYDIANFTAQVNASGLTVNILTNIIGWVEPTGTNITYNTTNLTTLGTFNITGYTNGDANYSASSKTYFFNVTDLKFSGNLADPNSPVNYSSTRNYSFSINLTGSVSSIIFESNFLGGSYQYKTNNSTTYNNITINNNSNIYWITFPALAAGSYSYRWIANDTNNVWISTDRLSYTINPVAITPPLTFKCSGCINEDPPWIAITSTPVTLTCSHTLSVNLNITGGSSSWSCPTSSDNDKSVSCAFNTPSAQGSDNYICTISPVYNYTGYVSGTLNWGLSTLEPINNPGGNQGNQQTGSFTITSSESSPTIEPGSSKTITITLKNTLSSDITDINITISGINKPWYELDKTTNLKLKRDGGNDTVKLTLNVPEDAERKSFSILVLAAGKELGLTNISRQLTITLTVPQEQAEQNVTVENITNETSNETTNQTAGPTGLISIRPEDLSNIVLLGGFIAAALVYIFRGKVTTVLTGGYKRSDRPRITFPKASLKLPKLSNLRVRISLIRKRKTNK